MHMPSATSAKQRSKNDGLTVITPIALATYAHVWEPREGLNPEKGKQYSVVLVFPKGTDLSKMKAAAQKAAQKMWGNKMPPKLKSPFRQGNTDKPDDPLFKNAVFITARSKQQPGIVDQNVQPIVDQMDFYSGCKCRASVYATGYDQKGNKGVTFLLNNIQKVADGKRLSGRKTAEEEFDDIGGDEGEDDDDGLFD
jgi:hypothetical protein